MSYSSGSKDAVEPDHASTVSRQGTFGAEDSSEGLVFGEVDEAEAFSTPLSVTRASSKAAECASIDGAFYSPATSPPAVEPPPDSVAAQHQTLHAAAAAAAAAAADDDATNGCLGANHPQHRDTTAAAAAAGVSALPGSSTSIDSSAADTGPSSAGPTQPLLEPAVTSPADAAAEPAPLLQLTPDSSNVTTNSPISTHLSSVGPAAVAPAAAGQASAAAAAAAGQQGPQQQAPHLGSQAAPAQGDGSSSSEQVGGQAGGAAPPSPSAASGTSSDTLASALTGEAAADAAAATAIAAAVAAAAESAADHAQLSDSTEARDVLAPLAAGDSNAAAAAAVAAAAAAGAQQGPSGGNQQQQQQQQQQQAGVLPHGTPPVSPIAVSSSGGLERAASWQLQHAAAAAAGTAAHPAPPRSDIDLARLSNTPASPHGEAGWAAWQQRRRHFFVLTAAGKPVFSRHGDEQALAGFMAVIQALLSVMSDQGDVIHSITVGSSSLEFLLRGQLYLVAVSSRGEAAAALRRQLELLYQSILMVATGGLERLLTRSPGYDVQQLLAGAAPSMNALISGYGDCPGWMTASVEPAPMMAADRQGLTRALQEAVKACDCLYGVLLVAGRVASVERGQAVPPLNVFDLLLLINFSSSNESLRHNETFVPVCLPNFQPNAFVHAYINCLDNPQQQRQQQHSPQQPGLQQQQQQQQQDSSGSSRGSFLLLLSGSADAFHRLSAAQQQFVLAVTSGAAGCVLARAQAAAVQQGCGRVRVEALPAPLGGVVGSTPLWHALIRYPQRHQHITLAYPQALFNTRIQVKQLVRAYCRLYCCAYGPLLEANVTATSAGPFGSSGSSSQHHSAASASAAAAAGRTHKLVWVTSQRWVTGLLVDREVEVFVTFDPLTDREAGLKMAEGLKRLFADKGRRQDLLIPGL